MDTLRVWKGFETKDVPASSLPTEALIDAIATMGRSLGVLREFEAQGKPLRIGKDRALPRMLSKLEEMRSELDRRSSRAIRQ